jgi:phospholipid-binding lipoprotein MlaA
MHTYTCVRKSLAFVVALLVGASLPTRLSAEFIPLSGSRPFVSAILAGMGAMLSRGIRGSLVVMALFGIGCLASAHADRPAPPSDPVFGTDTLVYPDPFEGMNRRIFVMNQQVDRWVFDPLTRTYRLVPAVVRRSVRRFLTNLNATSVIGNDLLQGELRDAAVVTARIVVNSTLGIAGLADPATALGLPYHHSDFGQTLALAGVGCGPYFIVPLLGPTTLRDGFGTLVDFAFRPTTYLFGEGALVEVISIQGAATGFVEREKNVEDLVALRDSSIDFYAALHSAYTQTREAAIRQRPPIRAP